MNQTVFNDLKLYGDLSRGELSGLENTGSGQQMKCSSAGSCWEISIEEAGKVKVLKPEEFDFRLVSGLEGVFSHPEYDLSVTLRWRGYGDWAAACNIGFTAGDSVRVSAVTFLMPGLVNPAGNGEQDYLMFPFKTGLKIPSPAETVFKKYERISTNYGPGKKLRHLDVIQSGIEPITEAQVKTFDEFPEEYIRDFSQVIEDDHIVWGRNWVYTYPATISMTWMDYCGPQGGFYFGAHDPTLEKACLFFAARRNQSGIAPGIDKVFNRKLSEWNGDFVIGLHPGDWHQGAELYRDYMISVLPDTPSTPEYFRQAPGVVSHYDMKWEDGTVIHRYTDLPEMHREGASHGYDIMLLAGWNNGGFDNYSLRYSTDDELGSEEELKSAIRKVHEAGGRVLFYVNALSISCDSPDFEAPGKEFAVIKEDGEIDYFGEFYLVHPMATMCSNVKEWRECIKRNIKYVLLELGGDGIYLDQIGSAPRDCHAPHHDHSDAWAMNYRKMLTEVRQELAEAGKTDYVFLTERAMDLHKDLLDCFLCYSFWQAAPDLCYPAMFRYTFPEVLLIDMAMQKPWSGKKPLEDKFVEETFCRQFVNGLKYWTYCHVPENETLKPFFDSAIKLYDHGVDYFTGGEYLDDLNIRDKNAGILVKEFAMPGKGRLLTVWNPGQEKGKVKLEDIVPGDIIIRHLEQFDEPIVTKAEGSCIDLPASRLALIEIPA